MKLINTHLTKSDIKWSQDLKAITKCAKKGVIKFLKEIEKRNLEINKHVKTNGVDIMHEVNGWYFEFELGTGNFKNRR